MSRTVDQIYQELVTEKNNQATLTGLQPAIDDEQTLLSDLTTPSRVAEWRLWLYMVALAIRTHEAIFDAFKIFIENLIANNQAGTARWLTTKAKEFQLGSALVWMDGQWRYDNTGLTPSAIEALKIIKRAAVVETGGQIRIKVAKLAGSVVTPLTGPEKTAFSLYITSLAPAGSNLVVISNAPDKMKLSGTIVVDPQIINPNDGSLLSNPSVFPISDAINNYLGDLPFNGRFTTTEFIDAIQKAPGTKRPLIPTIQAKYGALPYSSITDTYIPDAGYLIIDPAFPLNLNLTYSIDV
jgi:hypothetical protein